MTVDADAMALAAIKLWQQRIYGDPLTTQQQAALQSEIAIAMQKYARGGDYRDAPTSITEAKALRREDATAWTPRDALVFLLRAIDGGDIDPSELVVIHREPREGGAKLSTCHTVGDPYTHIAMLEYAKASILNEGD